ncbi:MAG: DUF167 domain-containing protein [Desulfobacterales bacterium]|nr:DUF167 domain-containing protein [Desulfobacterales bacterium]
MAKQEIVKTVIQVKVLPRSSGNQIIAKENGVLKIKVSAPAVEGKANKALQTLLSRKLGIAKRNVEIISGGRSRTKSIRITGMSLEEVNVALERSI